MAARLPEEAAPMKIFYPLETVYAEAGDVICFEPGKVRKARLMDYDHWSVKLDIFLTTYRNWDTNNWTPLPPVQHLMRHGCKPYYKFRGAWARQLTEETYVHSLESPEPALVPPGVWVAIGEKGEPWHIEDHLFRSRYLVPEQG